MVDWPAPYSRGDHTTAPKLSAPASPSQPVTAPAIRIDPEFAALNQPQLPSVQALLKRSLNTEGCRDPLVVWKFDLSLLDGHTRFAYCVEHDIPFQVVELDLPDRDAARDWIIANQLGRRNLPEAAASYLRGQRYRAERKPHGGHRPMAKASGHADLLRTADALARRFGVSASTIKRDAQFATAVDRIAAVAGLERKAELLSAEPPLTHARVVELAGEGDEAIRRWADPASDLVATDDGGEVPADPADDAPAGPVADGGELSGDNSPVDRPVVAVTKSAGQNPKPAATAPPTKSASGPATRKTTGFPRSPQKIAPFIIREFGEESAREVHRHLGRLLKIDRPRAAKGEKAKAASQ